MRWNVYRCWSTVHVAPVADERPHELTPLCDCKPILQPRPPHGLPLWVHKAFDGREICEGAIAALKRAQN